MRVTGHRYLLLRLSHALFSVVPIRENVQKGSSIVCIEATAAHPFNIEMNSFCVVLNYYNYLRWSWVTFVPRFYTRFRNHNSLFRLFPNTMSSSHSAFEMVNKAHTLVTQHNRRRVNYQSSEEQLTNAEKNMFFRLRRDVENMFFDIIILRRAGWTYLTSMARLFL